MAQCQRLVAQCQRLVQALGGAVSALGAASDSNGALPRPPAVRTGSLADAEPCPWCTAKGIRAWYPALLLWLLLLWLLLLPKGKLLLLLRSLLLLHSLLLLRGLLLMRSHTKHATGRLLLLLGHVECAKGLRGRLGGCTKERRLCSKVWLLLLLRGGVA